MQVAANYTAFKVEWYSYLTAWKGFYSALLQWKKESPAKAKWFDLKMREVRSDELLDYLYESRNGDEHNLSDPTRLEPGNVMFGVNHPGFSTAMRFDTLPDGSLRVQSLNELPLLNIRNPPRAILIAVTSNGYGKGAPKRQVAPPTTHLGITLVDGSPVGVAGLGLIHLKRLLEHARTAASV